MFGIFIIAIVLTIVVNTLRTRDNNNETSDVIIEGNKLRYDVSLSSTLDPLDYCVELILKKVYSGAKNIVRPNK